MPRSSDAPLRQLRTAAMLAVIVIVVGLIQFWRTFGLPFAYDDLDCLHLAADVLAGKEGFWNAAFRPHNEHLMPVMRMAFHASAVRFGIDAMPFRLVIFGAHLTTAWFLGLLALHYSRRPTAALVTAVAYVLPCGLSSMPVWVVIAAGLPVGIVGVSGAMLALANWHTLGIRRARLLAGAGCLMAVLTGSGLMPLLLGPLLVDQLERRRRRDRGLAGAFAMFCAATMVGSVLATAFFYARVYGHGPSFSVVAGLPRAAFLLVIAPYRYLLPGLGLPSGATEFHSVLLWLALGAAIAAPAVMFLLGLWRQGVPTLGGVTAAASVGPLGAVLLVGLGRSGASPIALFESDRYFFPLLFPFALLAGAVAASVADRIATWTARQRAAIVALGLVAFGAELFLHRRALLGRVPFEVFAAHERRFVQMSRLAQGLGGAASSLPPDAPPLRVPDGFLLFPDVHNRRISMALLLQVIGAETPMLQLGGHTVGGRDAAIVSEVLAAWGQAVEEPAVVPRIVGGVLMNPDSDDTVDFRDSADEGTVIAGFHPWEQGYRWMAGRGELRLKLIHPTLRLVLVAPMSQVGAALGIDALVLRVTAVDETSGATVTLGSLRVTADQPREYVIDASPYVSRFGTGLARLVLEADRTWRPIDVLAGSQDRRALSVMVISATSVAR